MHRYGVREVEKLLRLPRSTIRTFIEAGFVSPSRGPRNAWLFSFQDLIVLRTAQALAAAKVPSRRITRSVKELRRHLPDSMPLSGLSICAVADRVVVKEGCSRWQAESGQYLLAFEGDPADGSLSVVGGTGGVGPHVSRDSGGTGGVGGPHAPQVGGAHTPRSSVEGARTPRSSDEWFEKGVALEREDAEAALQAYERAVAADPARLDARINLGLLLHEAGRFSEAEYAYREAMKACGSDPALLYNLGVLLEDMDRKKEAMEAYEAALRGNPGLADCHYNLALLCEELKKPKDAIRHMAQYRKLLGTQSD
jgi:DNA-binding transcriptional MerR regulator